MNIFEMSNLGGSVAFTVSAILFAIAATVLAFIFIVPEKRREKLNAFGKFLHDTCNFKYLVVEKLLQAVYIFSTALVILNGFFMLFQVSYGRWLGGLGIVSIIVFPILLRLLYELLMMAVILVKNVITINKKLKDQNGSADIGSVFAAPDVSEMRESFKQRKEAQAQNNAAAAPAAAPVATPVATPVETTPVDEKKPRFCVNCGSPLDESGNCPNCK